MILSQKQRIDKWNRVMDAEINPYAYSHLILNKGAKNVP
jgi:hypothetical protein